MVSNKSDMGLAILEHVNSEVGKADSHAITYDEFRSKGEESKGPVVQRRRTWHLQATDLIWDTQEVSPRGSGFSAELSVGVGTGTGTFLAEERACLKFKRLYSCTYSWFCLRPLHGIQVLRLNRSQKETRVDGRWVQMKWLEDVKLKSWVRVWIPCMRLCWICIWIWLLSWILSPFWCVLMTSCDGISWPIREGELTDVGVVISSRH